MAAKKVTKRRPIYDQNYYKAQAILRDPWFKEKKAWLLKRFAEVGCPLPKKPFKKYQEYEAWNEKFWKRYSAMEARPEVAEARLRLTGNKERMSPKEYYALEDFRDNFLPPLYGQMYDEILEHFGIDRRDKGFRDFLEYHIFFGQNTYPTPPFTVSWRRSNLDEPMELLVKIYGHTKQEDFVAHWNWIAIEQKRLKDYRGKSKEWETFARDVEIYSLYKQIQAAGPKRRNIRKQEIPVDMQTFAELEGRYPNLTLANLRIIVARARKRLGEA